MNDHPFSFDPEDPRLTAYALGELHDPADRAAVEQTLQSSPGARAALSEIRAFTALLTAEYEQERTLAETSANIIAMPPNWPRRLLLLAAMLLLLASVAWLMVPRTRTSGAVFSLNQKLSSRSSMEAEVAKRNTPNLPPVTNAGSRVAVRVQAPESAKRPEEIPFPLPMGNTSGRIDLAQTSASPPLIASASGPSTALKEDGQAQIAALPARAAAPRHIDTLTASISSNVQIPTPSIVASAFDKLGTAKDDGRRQADAASARPMLAQTKSVRAMPSVAATDSAPAAASFISSKDTQAAADEPDTVLREQRQPGVAFPANAKRGNLAYRFDTATYEHLAENPFLAAKDNPLSTFSIDVDTASYANVRRFIESGSLPPPDAVRVEELVNYFPYSYAPPAPDDMAHPFAVHLEAAACPWNPQDRLVRIGIKGRELARDKRPASNLVFLIDVSGSMEPPERLPLIKASLRMLVEQLTENDRVAIVTYAGESGVALPSTAGDHKDDILRALDKLEAGGSTNGASGIKMAYKVAREGFIQGGTNRVILATDGDFNVGVTSQGDLVRLIEGEAKSGVFLSALGVGTDNYKDATMQKLADKGNGNYAYIDKLEEARKVLVEQMSGTLVTIAKDVKIQVEFNPAAVAAYRLIGYEKRMLRKEDFNDDRIDAGEIGAGHRVTALYEVVPVGGSVPGAAPAVDALRYGPTPAPVVDNVIKPQPTGELLTVKMRHKAPDGDKSERSYEESLTDHAAPNDFANASPDFKFAAAVASFGLVLHDSPYKGSATLGAAIELAQDGKGADPGEYRAGFIELARKAQTLQEGRDRSPSRP